MSVKLYEIPLLMQDLEAILVDAAGELTPEVEAAWHLLQVDSADKVEAATALLKGMQAEQAAVDTEVDRLKGRAISLENAQTRLRALLLPAVKALGGKVKTPKFTVYTTERKGVAFEMKPGHDLFELPGEFIRVKDPELNKTALKEAHTAGQTLPECLVVVETTSESLGVR